MPIRAKKSLGQHFLASPSYLRTIVDSAQIRSGDTVVEIGPGKGSLTKELLARGAHVIAIEKDSRLIPILTEQFKPEITSGKLRITEGDALTSDLQTLHLKDGAYTLVGNIPYYITGALFEKFLGQAPRPSRLVFLIQKEVAERIARSKKESILSLSIKAYGTPRYIKTVPRGAFSPAPSVDSAILVVEDISANHFASLAHEKYFFELLHAGFAHKRKLLENNVKTLVSADVLRSVGIPPNSRAEDIPLKMWVSLAAYMPVPTSNIRSPGS